MERDSELAGSSRRDRVTLVGVDGEPIGESDKLRAHEPPGRLHLAFSVFLYGPDGRLLLQRRAASKYHFPLVWANSCCSHPVPGDDSRHSAEQRVAEELGLSCTLEHAGQFVYQASCASSGLVEHEYDLVFVGDLIGEPAPDPAEVEELCLIDPRAIADSSLSGSLAPWFGEALIIAAAYRSRQPTRGLGLPRG